MDIAWQDSVGSFLDWSGTDPGSSLAALLSGDGGAVWSAPADGDSFSGQSVLWESRGDAPGDSHLATFDPNATDTDTLARTWIADGTSSGLLSGSPSLDSGLLWAGAGSEGSSSLSTSGGVGGLGSLTSLDLGAGGSSQWQQFVDQFANPSATWLPQHLVWPAGSSQPPLGPTTLDSLHLADSLAGPTFPTLAPEHLMWTDPSLATGLTAGPNLGNAAATTVPSSLGGPVDLLASTGPFSLGPTR